MRMISPTWCQHADHNNARPNCCWMVTQAAVTLLVFDAVVSSVMLTIESAQCQDVSSFAVSSAIISPQRRSEPDLYAGTPNNFSSRVSPTTTVKRSSDVFALESVGLWALVRESQCNVRNFGTTHSCFMLLAMLLPMLHLHLSAVA